MNNLDWDAEFDFVTGLNKCSDNLMLGSPTAASKKTRKEPETKITTITTSIRANPLKFFFIGLISL